jgi:predicted dehydrogenase
MSRGNLSRRGFLNSAAAVAAATGLPLWYVREVIAADEAKPAAKAATASDRVIMGAIGIGSPQSRGRAIYNEARRLANVQYIAACDVDAGHLERAVKQDMAKNDKDVTGYKDYRQLLEDKNINAVTIATPDHWHALVAIEAMKRGKDVYCEKPLTLTIAEGQALVKVAKETNRVFQTGSQQRSEMGGKFRLAVDLVRNGRIGKISKIECRIGGNPTSGPIPEAAPPTTLDWDMWLGPTPKVPYRISKDGKKTNCHYEYRWIYAYSGGKLTDWGAHHLDIAQWALDMDKSGPVAVEALMADKPATMGDGYDTHPKFDIKFTYANGVDVHAMSEGENGVKFFGENNQWIFVSRSKIDASDKKLIEEPLAKDAKRVEAVPGSHMANFIDCIKSRKLPICNVEVGHRSVTVCHLGVIALQTGKKLKWDPAKEEFVGDADANKLLSRAYRAPWKLEA